MMITWYWPDARLFGNFGTRGKHEFIIRKHSGHCSIRDIGTGFSVCRVELESGDSAEDIEQLMQTLLEVAYQHAEELKETYTEYALAVGAVVRAEAHWKERIAQIT